MTDCRYGREKEKCVVLAPNQWKQIFKVCSNHISVKMTVLGIFTKILISMSFASFWVMMLHLSQRDFALGYDVVSYPRTILPWVMMYHIPEGFCPGL